MSATLASRPPESRPLAIRGLIAATGLASRIGLYRPRFDAQRLLDGARRRTGLEDFGDGLDGEGLRRLLDGLESEARLHALGRIAAQRDISSLLENRLRLVAERKRHPAIAGQPIVQPVFIVGLPRTGTTLLHRLLAQDPAHRAPATWEILHPVAAPSAGEPGGNDPRIAQTARELRWLDRLAPQVQHMHRVGATLPEECIAIMGHSFASDRFAAMYRLPGYQAWFENHDLRPAYADHQRFLQHLQWREPPRRWLLKAPAHLFALDALIATYPDALIVHCHRDPVRIIASLASLMTALHGAFSDRVDPVETGRDVARRWAEALNRGIAARRGPHGGRFIDLHYHDLMRDPIAAVEQLYAGIGSALTGTAKAAMQRFLAENPQHRFGRHRYALESFGLDFDNERRRYRGYQAHFGVPDEAGSSTA